MAGNIDWFLDEAFNLQAEKSDWDCYIPPKDIAAYGRACAEAAVRAMYRIIPMPSVLKDKPDNAVLEFSVEPLNHGSTEFHPDAEKAEAKLSSIVADVLRRVKEQS